MRTTTRIAHGESGADAREQWLSLFRDAPPTAQALLGVCELLRFRYGHDSSAMEPGRHSWLIRLTSLPTRWGLSHVAAVGKYDG